MSKYLDPKFIAGLIAMAAITLNRKFLWNLDEVELTASIGVTVNFIIVQMAEDIQKMKNGEKPSWNSTKLVTMLFATIMIGFTQYVGLELNTEEVLWIAGIAGAFITGKGIKDIAKAKLEGGAPVADNVAKDYDYSGLDSEKTHSV